MVTYRINLVPLNQYRVPMFDCTNGVPTCLKTSWKNVDDNKFTDEYILLIARKAINDIIIDGDKQSETSAIIGRDVKRCVYDMNVIEVYVTFEIGVVAFIPIGLKIKDHNIITNGTDDVKLACKLLADSYSIGDISVTGKPFKLIGISVDQRRKTVLRNIGGNPDVFRSRTVEDPITSEADVYVLADEMFSECLVTPSNIPSRVDILGRLNVSGVDTFYVQYRMSELDYFKIRTLDYVNIETEHEDYDLCTVMAFKRNYSIKEHERVINKC